jgi:hypothetical protein
MVYFVHSFSAASPTSRATVGGMWLDRGAYAYLGSVDEPFLQAFIPTPIVMARLATGYPWGAAVRMDGGELWKLAVFGDPLITWGPQGKRPDNPAVPLAGASDLASFLPEQLRAKDFESAIWTLVLTGRDKDAARLLAALAKDDAEHCTPTVALAGLISAYFIGDYQTFILGVNKAATALDDPNRVKREGLAEIRDMVWQAAQPSIGKPTPAEADALALCLRPENLAADTRQAILAAESARGPGSARPIQERAARLAPKLAEPMHK